MTRNASSRGPLGDPEAERTARTRSPGGANLGRPLGVASLTLLMAAIAGCGQRAAASVNPALYTCADLQADFNHRGDAPADRLQALIDTLAVRASDSDRTPKALTEELVYALTKLCDQSARPSYTPAGDAVRYVQKVQRGGQ